MRPIAIGISVVRNDDLAAYGWMKCDGQNIFSRIVPTRTSTTRSRDIIGNFDPTVGKGFLGKIAVITIGKNVSQYQTSSPVGSPIDRDSIVFIGIIRVIGVSGSLNYNAGLEIPNFKDSFMLGINANFESAGSIGPSWNIDLVRSPSSLVVGSFLLDDNRV